MAIKLTFVNTKTIAAIALASILVISAFSMTAYAPKGIPKEEKLVKHINYIARPVTSSGTPPCDDSTKGSVIWTLQGKRSGHIEWEFHAPDGIHIIDRCTESIDSTWALVHLDRAGVYNIYARVNAGAPGDVTKKLTFCVNTKTDELGDHLCLLGTFDVTKSNSFTKISSKIFAGDLENIVYHIDQETKFKKAELRITLDP